jgi:hypothetical protein
MEGLKRILSILLKASIFELMMLDVGKSQGIAPIWEFPIHNQLRGIAGGQTLSSSFCFWGGTTRGYRDTIRSNIIGELLQSGEGISYHIVFSLDVSDLRPIFFSNHPPAQDLLCVVLLEGEILVVSVHNNLMA